MKEFTRKVPEKRACHRCKSQYFEGGKCVCHLFPHFNGRRRYDGRL